LAVTNLLAQSSSLRKHYLTGSMGIISARFEKRTPLRDVAKINSFL